jgi:four helix bundle protein
MGDEYHGYKDLIVYKKAFKLSISIFRATKEFPREEMYSLTDQIRRSSRSIGANLAESWAKRRYVKSFTAKLIDSQSEACETCHWLDQSIALNYINTEQHKELTGLLKEIQKMLNAMIQNPNKFCHP